MPEKSRTILIVGFAFLFISMFWGMSKTIKFQGYEEFYRHNFGEYAVALGTGVLGLFTAYLAIVEIEEGRKERKRLRLKEQLEYYNPLVHDIRLNRSHGQFTDSFIGEELSKKVKLTQECELYGEDDLIKLIHIAMQHKLGGFKSKEEFYTNLLDTVITNFEEIKNEYIKLT